MSVHVTLRKCVSEANRVHKEFLVGGDLALEGDFREPEQDVLHPSIRIASSKNIAEFNYVEITEFGRKYFMHPTALNNGMWRLDCDVDVLTTYATGIDNSEALVKRTAESDMINYYINDGVFYTEQRERVTYTTFKKNGEDASFGTPSYYMIVAGG